ncbi:MAG: hypothetical protein H7245_03420 [Candidatus Saccharibacteria bacterium]|nr:hypothetical protein [Pseudorhodobacter sp.]
MLILADDLTGAMDAAAPFQRQGAETVVCWSADQAGPATVVSVNTASRGLAPSAAAQIVAAKTARWCARPGSGPLFKKVDSTLRGNTMVEVMAAFATGQFRTLVFCPALPAEGRVVRQGALWIHGRSLPDWLGQSGQMVPHSIAAHFADLGPAQIVNLRPGDQVPAASAPQILIYDAETDADLDQIAQASTRLAGPLLAGSSGLAAALARRLPQLPQRPAPLPAPDRVLFVIGSRSSESWAQVDALRAVFPNVTLLAAERLPQPDATGVEHRLAVETARHLRASVPDALFLSGGATAEAVLHHLQTRFITLTPPPLDGIAAGICATRFGPLQIWTKAGAFGSPDILARLMETQQSPVQT